MSGGSHEYAYRHVQDMADTLSGDRSPLRRAFAEHLKLVAAAMHDVEWVDSCDYGRDGDVEAIRKVVSPATVLVTVKEDAERVLQQLREALASNG